jgi:Asp-tRNA(Asn)/Glu-tRNA(Gln) amidotransferase B subunit
MGFGSCARLVPRPDEKDSNQIVEAISKENSENLKKYLAGKEKILSLFCER